MPKLPSNYIPDYEQDGITLYNGKCEDILPRLPDKSVDAVITDPPYNVGLSYHGYVDRRKDYAEWCLLWFAELLRICRGPIAFTPGTVNLGMWYRIKQPDWLLCWYKTSASCCPVGANHWEPILLYGKSARGKYSGCDVIKAPSVTRDIMSGDHACTKPLKWAVGLLRLLTSPNSLILDPFLGSGTVAVSCLNEGRECIGIESNPYYYDISVKRLEDSVGGGIVSQVKDILVDKSRARKERKWK